MAIIEEATKIEVVDKPANNSDSDSLLLLSFNSDDNLLLPE